jgi:putative SOS response-associated peptidase YedK
MCGSFGFTLPVAETISLWHISTRPTFPWPKSLNIRPTQPVVTVVQEGEHRRLALMRWGLIPHWSKDAKIASHTFNARAETVAEKPSFRSSFKSKRCLVLADGFYEWRKPDKRKYFIFRRDGKPISFAGLWSSWTDPATQKQVDTCTIITTTPNKMMEKLHDRMPVILTQPAESIWTDSTLHDTDPLQALLNYREVEHFTTKNAPPEDDGAWVREIYRHEGRVVPPVV